MTNSGAPVVNGQVMQLARKRMGLTLRDVADRCSELGQKVDYSTLARWEQRPWSPRQPRVLPVLAQVLGLRVDELVVPHDDGDDGQAAL